MKITLDAWYYGEGVDLFFVNGVLHAHILCSRAIEDKNKDATFRFDGKTWTDVADGDVVIKGSGFGKILYTITDKIVGPVKIKVK